jgi:hypothetical protein
VSATITAICPECQTRYHLKPEMAGRRMRCTNPACRAAFAVEGEAPPVFDWREGPPPVQETAPDGRVESANPRAAAVVVPAAVPERRGRRGWAVAALAVGVLAGLAGAGAWVVRTLGGAEERLARQAEAAWADGRFKQAANDFARLVDRRPHGVRAKEFQFLAALANVRWLAGVVPPKPEPAWTALTQFLDEHGASPFLTARRVDVYQAALKLTDDFAVEGEAHLRTRPPDVSAADQRAARARAAAAVVARFAPAGADAAPARQKVQTLADALDRARVRVQTRSAILELLGKPRPDLDAARGLIDRGGFRDDAEVAAAWKAAEESVRRLVTYRAINRPAVASEPQAGGWTLETGGVAGSGPRVSALANGVLYAIEAASGDRPGRIAWLDRLGVDASIPALPLSPETWVVVSTDPPALEARDVQTGAVRWRQALADRPVGPPVVAGGRIFVALGGASGAVYDVDATTGRLRGAFETPGRLAGGVGHRPGTARLYVPADAQHVFIFDFAPPGGNGPQCIATLATQHRAGSVRTAPVVIAGPSGQSQLLLTIAEGVGETALYLFPAGDTSSAAGERVRLPGWVWGLPVSDGSRIAAVSDTGALALLGLRGAHAADPPMFPLFAKPPAVAEPTRFPVRALVAGLNDSAVVTIAGGRLQRWRLGVDRAQGWALRPAWPRPVEVGSPAHDPTVVGETMFVTSQRTTPPMTLLTAVRVATGEVVWQRSLGLSPAAALASAGARVFIADPGGTVAGLDLAGDDPRARWHLAGRLINREEAGEAPLIVSGPGGRRVAVQPAGRTITVTRLDGDGPPDPRRVELPAPLRGTPALGPAALILPLADGRLYRLADGDRRAEVGPTWRAGGAGPDTPGHVTHWFDATYLVTDGSRRLTRLNWPAAGDFDLASATALERPERRLIGPALPLPGEPRRAVFADAAGHVLLVNGDRLDVERSWSLGGDGREVSAGPTWTNGLVLFSINGRELIALDILRDAPAWTLPTPGDGWIGTATPLGDSLVAADRSGRLWGIDPATGRPRVADGYRLGPTVAAAGPPVAVGGDRLFIPLTDGTAVVLRAAELAPPLPAGADPKE